ncbi:acyltransferase family protein [Agarivorans gilvus]|uniref:acyltransferase family protein n=1 Tax=Agarivorans gilvus TaxID=680279 RepID=UPI0006EC285B|nr:acyltransferase [Agarivorans gilvus]
MYLNLPSLSNSNYRADIDGIRAIAVLSVIIFHINKAILPGGFIGVDIFFVISGYLITLHILSDIKSNKFSIFDFYKRRIKRIAPVMLVVIASVIICSLVIQRPEDTKEVAKTSIAALFSLSNIYFWLFQDSSYFAQSSEEIPLLHFWSLGVEEQFYIFWPLTLLFFKKSHKKTSFIISLFVISFISFSLGQYIYASSPSFVYYMLPTRGGELLIGSLTAYLVSKKTILTIPSSILFLLSLTGISLIVASLFYFSENIIFPGLYAIIPTTGTAMLILSGHYGTCWIKRILMHRLLVFIGLISYSAYLWHWPLLSFSRYSLIEINLINGILIFITTLIISTASYYFIEKPTRKYNGSVLKTASYLYLIPTIIISSLSFMMYKSDGMFMHRNQNAYEKISVKPAYKYDYVCQRWEIKDEDIKNKKCIIGNAQTEKEPKVLLWGIQMPHTILVS